MAYRGFSGGGFVGNHLTAALLEALRPAADNAGRHATVGDPTTVAAPYVSDGASWKSVQLIAEAPTPSGGDDTAALQAAINAASSSYSAAAGRVRLVFRPGQYSVTGLLIKPNVWYDFGEAEFLKSNDGSGTAFGTTCSASQAILRTQESLVGGTTYYGNYDDIKITGGTFNVQDKTLGAGGVVLLNLRRARIHGMRIIRSGTAAFWSTMIGGQDIEIHDMYTSGGTVAGQDGLHIVHGRGVKVFGGYFGSGDDAIAIGSDNLGQLFDDEGIEQVSVVNPYVNSVYAFALKVYYKAPGSGSNRHKVRGVRVTNLMGICGQTSNGAIGFYDHSGVDSVDVTRIQDVHVTCDLDVGGASHNGTAASAILVQAAKDWSISGRIKITDTTGGSTRFIAGQIDASLRGKVDVNFPLVPANGGIYVRNLSTSVHNLFDTEICGTFVYNASSTIAGVVLQSAVRTKVSANFIDIPTSVSGIRSNAPTVSGVQSTLSAIGCSFVEASGATTTVGINSAAASRMVHANIVGCDFNGVDSALDASFATNVATRCIAGNRGLANAEDTTP